MSMLFVGELGGGSKIIRRERIQVLQISINSLGKIMLFTFIAAFLNNILSIFFQRYCLYAAVQDTQKLRSSPGNPMIKLKLI